MAWIGAAIGGAASLFGASRQAGAAEDAARAQERAAQAQIEYNRESRDLARSDVAPYREAGYTALDALMSMTGLPRSQGYRDATSPPAADPAATPPGPIPGRGVETPPPTWDGNTPGRPSQYGDYVWADLGDGVEGWRYDRWALPQSAQPEVTEVPPIAAYRGAHAAGGNRYNVSEIGPENVYSGGRAVRYARPRTIGMNQGGYVQPNENPGGDESYRFQTDPGYNFRFNEGMRGLERGAAARGGLLSGGFGRAAIRYGQDYASNEYTNVYNRISNIAGMGTVPQQLTANAAMNYGNQAGMGALYGGYANASGQMAQGNIWGNAINGIGQDLAGIDWGGLLNRGQTGNQNVMGTAADPWSLDMGG